jgi:hypothetical protein
MLFTSIGPCHVYNMKDFSLIAYSIHMLRIELTREVVVCWLLRGCLYSSSLIRRVRVHGGYRLCSYTQVWYLGIRALVDTFPTLQLRGRR